MQQDIFNQGRASIQRADADTIISLMDVAENPMNNDDIYRNQKRNKQTSPDGRLSPKQMFSFHNNSENRDNDSLGQYPQSQISFKQGYSQKFV